jgi:hypothetical protein
MLKRLFPSRWARIIAWTGAALAWGTSVVAVQAQTEQSAATSEPVSTPEPEPAVQEVPQPLAAVPAPPEAGLVVIRYTPVPPPAPEVITRTVTVSGGGGGGGATTSTGGGGGSTATSGGSTASRPSINVASSGS